MNHDARAAQGKHAAEISVVSSKRFLTPCVRTWSGSCTPATITAWAKDISAYIKSIDSNHLVAIGDEGFYNQPGAPTYPYQ